MKGQWATFLYSGLAHKEATGNSAYFLEYKPHLTYSFKVACPSKEQVHEERVESWSRYLPTKHLDKNVVQTFRQFFPHWYDKHFEIGNHYIGIGIVSIESPIVPGILLPWYVQ